MESHIGDAGKQRATLDVGGTMFKTNVSTLLRGNTFFAKHLPLLNHTTLFVDRNPAAFACILDLLRGYPLNLEDLEPGLRAKVVVDLVYFGMTQ